MTPAPRNAYEVWEDANLHFAAAETALLTRWATELDLPAHITSEVVAEIQSRSNGTEMGEAA